MIPVRYRNDCVISAYGVKMPKLIYGTAWKKERTAGLVEKAVKLGFRGIDTACQPKHYLATFDFELAAGDCDELASLLSETAPHR